MSAVAMGARGRSESIPGRAMPRWPLRHLLGSARLDRDVLTSALGQPE